MLEKALGLLLELVAQIAELLEILPRFSRVHELPKPLFERLEAVYDAASNGLEGIRLGAAAHAAAAAAHAAADRIASGCPSRHATRHAAHFEM